MNTIVKNFLIHIKTKQPDKWGVSDMEDLALALQVIYKYLEPKEKEEKEVLKDIYAKMVNFINTAKKGHIINPGYLNYIDRVKSKNEELPL